MKLLEPGHIGSMTLRNRVFMAPMGTTTEPDGSFSDRAIRYLEERAIGGFGLIITGANQVSLDYEQKACNVLGSGRSLAQLNFLARRIHDNGARLCVQLTTGLGRMQLPFAAEVAPYAASDVESYWFPGLICKPLSVEQIHDLVEKMAAGALMAKNAGADAIEVHGYGGYLLDQFCSTLWNKRTDEYGGDLAGRMRFGIEIVQAIRAAVGPAFPILYKFTPYHGVEGGRELPEGLEMARMLEAAGVDALHVDMGCYEKWYLAIDTVYQPPATQAWLAAEVRKVVSVPVLTQGKLQDPDVAERVLAGGQADFVGLAHGALADPLWVNKVRHGEAYDIVPCIGCNECLNAGFKGGHYRCAVNPRCFAEEYFPVTRTDDPKRILVIGGGPGGMEFAITAAERGHHVELWEKTARLGGTLYAAGGPTFKADVKHYADYLVNKVNRTPDIEVRTMKDATPAEILAGKWDKVVLATGARHLCPPIDGIDNPRVILANDVLAGRVGFGPRVVVIGAGLVGCETAAHCAQTAESVVVLEALPQILASVDHCRNNAQALDQLLADAGVEFITGARVTRLGDAAVTYAKDGQTHSIGADSYILAAGYTSNGGLFGDLADSVDVALIGDAVKPESIATAVNQGFHLARNA